MLQNIGSFVLSFCRVFGAVVLLTQETIVYCQYIFRYRKHIFKQMYAGGVKSLPLTVLVTFVTSLVFAVLLSLQVKQQGQQRIIAPSVAKAITQDIGPLQTAIIVTAGVGSAMASEIGAMNVTEQIDALRVFAVPPARYLVMPRFIAMILVLPILTVISDLVGIIAGFIVSVKLGLDLHGVMRETFQVLTMWDVCGGIIKSMVFGSIIAIIGCFSGLRAEGGAEGVGRATTSAAVKTIVTIIVADFVMTLVIY